MSPFFTVFFTEERPLSKRQKKNIFRDDVLHIKIKITQFSGTMDVAILHEEFVEGDALGHQVMIMTMMMVMLLMVIMIMIMNDQNGDDDEY